MVFYCIKRLVFTKNRNIKQKYEIDTKNNLYSWCIDFSFKKFQINDEEELIYLLEGLIQL